MRAKVISGVVGLTILAFAFAGCVTATIPCPTDGTEAEVVVNGADISSLAASLVGVIGQLAATGLLAGKAPVKGAMKADAPAPAAAATPVVGQLTFKTVPFFGTQGAHCGTMPPGPVAAN